MSNCMTVSFKLAPEYYVLVKAMAQAAGATVSEYLRDTVLEALNLEHEMDRLASLFTDGYDDET